MAGFVGRIQKSSGVFVAFFGVTVGTVVAATAIGRSGELDWARIGEIGQALGALLAGGALVGVVVSLLLQRRQTQVATFEALSGVRTQLLQLAIEHPPFLRLWGYEAEGAGDPRETAYLSMIFAYLGKAYEMGVLTEKELVGFCRVFSDPSVVGFWGHAREIYLSDPSSQRSRRFAQIVEREYRRMSAASTEA